MADGTLTAEAFRPAPRIAVLVDADNVQNGEIAFAVAEASRHGTVALRRAFGRLRAICGHEKVLTEYGFSAEVTLPRAKSGKNAADLLLAEYALRLAERRAVEIVALVSSDGDFAAVAGALTEHGVRTIGIARPDAPVALREACTISIAFPTARNTCQAADAPKGSADDRRKAKRLIDAILGTDGRARAALVGARINSEFEHYKRHFGVANLGELLLQLGGYELLGEGIEREVVRAGGG